MEQYSLQERNDEIELLIQQADVSKSSGAFVLLSGEAGNGKSRLIEEFEVRYRDKADFIWGRCDPFSDSVVLSSILDISGIFSKELREKLNTGVPNHELFHCILDELIDLKSPTVLIFEDMHWADKLSIDLLLFLGRRLSSLKLMILISFREDELKRVHPIFQLISSLPPNLLTRIQLKPLSSKAVAKILNSSEKNTKEIYQLTNGNPLFVTELASVWKEGRDPKIPTSIVDLVKARMTQLDAETMNIVEALSTVPEKISVTWFTELSNNHNWTREHLSAILETGLLVQQDENCLKFKHELLRMAIESQLPMMEKISAHEKFLAIFESSVNPLITKLVYHASGANLPHKTIHYTLLATKAMEEKGAYREAAKYLRIAMRFVADAEPSIAAELYERWAFNESLTYKISDAVIEAHRQAISLWKAVGETEKVVRNLQYLARLHRYRGEIIESSRLSDQAIKLCQESDEFAMELGIAYALRAQLHMLRDQLVEAIKWGQMSIDIAKIYKDEETLIHSLNTVGTAKVFSAQSSGEADLKESLQLAIDGGYYEHASRAYNNLAEHAVESRQYDIAESWFKEGISFNIKYNLDLKSHYFLGRQAYLRMEQGEYESAKIIAEGILNIVDISNNARLPALIALTRTSIRIEGSTLDTNRMYREAKSLATQIDEPQNLIAVLIAGIEAAWLSKNEAQYKFVFEELAKIPWANFNPWQYSEIVMWSHRLRFPLQLDLNRPICKVVQQELDGHVSEAADEWLNIGAPFQAACLLAAKASHQTETQMKKAMEIFTSLGSNAGVNRVTEDAVSVGLSVVETNLIQDKSPLLSRHPLGLTKREQQILKLLITGLSNQDIADELNRSVRTIEHHVSGILSKLNIENRVEAIIRVQSEPWLLNSSAEKNMH